MIVKYKGFEIEAVKTNSTMYYSVFRMEDNWELTCGYEVKSKEKVRDVVNDLKDMVDGHLLNINNKERGKHATNENI